MFRLLLTVATLVNVYASDLSDNVPGIEWHIKDPPISFGRDAILFCNASRVENCCSNTATWMQDYDVIIHHSISANYLKYEEIQVKDGFYLTIKSFNEDDLNHQYTCLYDFYAYSRTIEINNNDIKMIPSVEEVKAEFITTAKKVSAMVIFEKVFPLPECKMMFNTEIMPSQISIKNASNGLFQNATIEMICQVEPAFCEGNISVECSVGDESIIKTAKIQNYCQSKSMNHFVDGIAAGSAAFILIMTVCFVIVIIIKRKHRFRHLDLEGTIGVRLDGALFGCKNTGQLSEENEMTPLLLNQMKLDEISCNVSWVCIPVQRCKDVILIFGLLMELCVSTYHQLITTNIRIDQARRKNQKEELSDVSLMSRVNNLVSLSYLGRPNNDKSVFKERDNKDENIKEQRRRILEVNNKMINEARRLRWIIDSGVHDQFRQALFPGQTEVTRIIDFDKNYDQSSLYIRITNARINEERYKKQDSDYSYFDWVDSLRALVLSSQSDQFRQVLSPGQTEVTRMIDFDKNYDQSSLYIRITNARINEERYKKQDSDYSFFDWVDSLRALVLPSQSAIVTKYKMKSCKSYIRLGKRNNLTLATMPDERSTKMSVSNQIINLARRSKSLLKDHKAALH